MRQFSLLRIRSINAQKNHLFLGRRMCDSLQINATIVYLLCRMSSHSRYAPGGARPSRRITERVSTSLRVTYASDNLNFSTVSVDLSHTGVLLLTPLCDVPGTTASLTLDLPGEGRRSVGCRVVRVHHGLKPGMGLEFIGAEEEVQELLHRYWQQHELELNGHH